MSGEFDHALDERVLAAPELVRIKALIAHRDPAVIVRGLLLGAGAVKPSMAGADEEAISMRFGCIHLFGVGPCRHQPATEVDRDVTVFAVSGA